MSTNGIYGFVKGGKFKVTYNHFDSYPENLGKSIWNYARLPVPDLVKACDSIELVNPNKKPTKKQKEKYQPCSDLSVSKNSLNDWYCLLRGIQGDLWSHESYGVMLDYSDSFEEGYVPWAYIINLDEKTFDIYTQMYNDKLDDYALTRIFTVPLNKMLPNIPVNKIYKEIEKINKKDPNYAE